jgi:hypothetical protein
VIFCQIPLLLAVLARSSRGSRPARKVDKPAAADLSVSEERKRECVRACQGDNSTIRLIHMWSCLDHKLNKVLLPLFRKVNWLVRTYNPALCIGEETRRCPLYALFGD